jgi:hypothetical protein
MKNKNPIISSEKKIAPQNKELDELDLANIAFQQELVNKCATAAGFLKPGDHSIKDIDAALAKTLDSMIALKDNNNLEIMLITEMLSIHNLQQAIMSATNIDPHNSSLTRYLTNTAIKLTNTFTQQAQLLEKLQTKNISPKPVIVKKVNVHNGGQAIVGNVNHHA